MFGRERCGRGLCTVLFIGLVSLVWAAPAAFGQLSNGRIAYWKFNGNYNDEGPGALHLTPNGGIGFGVGLRDQGVDFPNDAAKYLERSVDDAAFDFGGGDFTIALWLRFNSLAGEQILLDKASTQGWTLSKTPDNSFAFSVTGPSSPGSLLTPILPITAGDWHHLAIVRSGTALTIYFENGPVATNAGFVGSIADSANPLRLGRLHDAPGIPFNGTMDEIGIWSRALSTGELAELFSWGPQAQSNLVGYWKFDGSYADVSPDHRNLSASGNVVFGEGVLGQGIELPGVASQFVFCEDSAFEFGDKDFTLSVWAKFLSTAQEQFLLDKSPWTLSKDPQNRLAFSVAGPNSPGSLVSPIQPLVAGAWHHVAVVRSGTTLTIYFDGTVVASTSSFVGSIANSSTLNLGGSFIPLNGAMDEVAIWLRALSASEINDLYTAHQMICGCTTQPSGFGGGDGSPENPFQVCSPRHLDNVRNHLSAHFVQTRNIDMSGINFVPIGTPVAPFSGSYKGNAHAILNLNIDLPAVSYVGLFATIASAAHVSELEIQGRIVGDTAVGALAGANYGLVEHVRITGDVTGFSLVGGLIGESYGTISTASSSGSVAGDSMVGGLLGILETGSVLNSYSESTVISASAFGGGLIGFTFGAALTNLYAVGAVSGGSVIADSIGGLVGKNGSSPSSSSACYWNTQTSGLVTSAYGVGKTTAEMQVQSSFDPPWDFITVWQIDEGSDYPRLQHETSAAGPTEISCENGIDDDCDSYVDCALLDCELAGTCVPIQLDLIGYWKLDGDYIDLSPGHRHLSAFGGIGFGTGVRGQAVEFPADGAKHLQRDVDDDVFDFGDEDFTVSLWARFNSTLGEQIVLEKAGQTGWTLSKDPTNKLAFSVTGPGSPGSLVTPIQQITANSWQHLAVVREGTTLTLFFNGLPVADSSPYVGSIDDSPNPLLLGRRLGDPALPLDGALDEVAIWGRALSATEITDLYRSHQMICGCRTQPTGFGGGNGTPSNPYEVCSPLHLDNVRNHLTAHFVQTADIDMTGISFQPIGRYFSGSYDGRYYLIKSLTLGNENTSEVGLFRRTGSSAFVKSILLDDFHVSGRYSLGMLVGLHLGTIADCHVSGSVIGSTTSGGQIGGLAGYGYSGSIVRSSSRGAVLGRNFVGGLIGRDFGTAVIDCYTRASVTSTNGETGGLIGALYVGGTVADSYSVGSVSGPGKGIGGLIGYTDGAPVLNSFWDQQAAGVSTSWGGFGKDTAEMQMQSTFDPPWDFDNVWMIDEGNDYPRLRWEAITPPGPSETSCDNALDDDCDSFVDCDDLECTGHAACILAPEPVSAESPGTGKVRFVSFVVPATSAGTDTALRVELTSLHHPSSPPPGTPDFTTLEGQFRYVNAFGGSTLCVDSATFATNYRCGQLGCQPEYRDWATDLSAATNPASDPGLIHVTGDAVVPSSTLTVSHIAASCGASPAADTCAAASAGLAVLTSRWGDVAGSGGSAPDGIQNVIDIGSVVDNVKGIPTAIPERRAWMKNPPNVFGNPVNVIDIGLTVDSVKGFPYPYTIAACP